MGTWDRSRKVWCRLREGARSFEGPAGRATYAACSLAAFSSQHAIALIARTSVAIKPALPELFWIDPFRGFVYPRGLAVGSSAGLILIGLATILAGNLALLLLAGRRARRLEGGMWIAALTLVPVLQIGAIAWLIVSPERLEGVESADERTSRLSAEIVIQGVLLGIGLIVVTVALSTIALGTYGLALFVVSPVVIACVVGYLANRNGQIGSGRTLGLVFLTFCLGGLALTGLAFEGVICLILASPLVAVMGVIGGLVGAELSRIGRGGGRATLSSVAILPFVMMAEAILPPHAAFESVESVEIDAPPDAVWNAVVHMGPIPDAPAVPFRWGLAYPLRGEILGTGVGSLRRGVFSTGVAYERVTVWEPGRRLCFDVLSDPPTMQELSPYAHVNAPHVNGYFKTLDARFTMTPLPDGRTRLTLATRHELDLAPALYWQPIASWAVHANKVRVLAHFRSEAEAGLADTSRKSTPAQGEVLFP